LIFIDFNSEILFGLINNSFAIAGITNINGDSKQAFKLDLTNEEKELLVHQTTRMGAIHFKEKGIDGTFHPVALAAQAFYRLICIHPFENGNTRTASLVMNYILMKNGYPPFILTKDNEKEFYKMERFMEVLFYTQAAGITGNVMGSFVDEKEIFNYVSDEYTTFLASQIKQRIEVLNWARALIIRMSQLGGKGVSFEEMLMQVRRYLATYIDKTTDTFKETIRSTGAKLITESLPENFSPRCRKPQAKEGDDEAPLPIPPLPRR